MIRKLVLVPGTLFQPSFFSQLLLTVDGKYKHQPQSSVIKLPYTNTDFNSTCTGFSSMWTENFQLFKLVVEKVEEPEIKLPTFIGS